MIARRPTSLKAICCAAVPVGGGDGDDVPHPLGVRDGPLQSLHPAHRAADHGVQFGRCPGRRGGGARTSTMSAMVTRGKSVPYGRPVAGLRDDGPVVPRQPPSTLAQMTK